MCATALLLAVITGCADRTVEGSATAPSERVIAAPTGTPTTTPPTTRDGPTTLDGVPTCADIGTRASLPELAELTQSDSDASFSGVLRKCEWTAKTEPVKVEIWHYSDPFHPQAAFANLEMLCGSVEVSRPPRATKAAFCDPTFRPKCQLNILQGNDLVSVEWGTREVADNIACRKPAQTLGGAASALLP